MAGTDTMKKIFLLLLIIFAITFFLSPLQRGDTEPREAEGSEKFIEIKIPCKKNSDVKALMPNGEIITLGKVLMTPSKTNWPAYAASKWSGNSTVCASAVNAIHILINVEKGRGRIISLVPSVTVAPAAAQGAFFSLGMEAGTGIFGGYAPLVGSKVTIENDEGERDLTDVPKENETLIIRTELPENPKNFMVEIENRPGGRVIAFGKKGREVIARVIHRVSGIGRFGGSIYQNNGRIRASHAGVICVATSKRDTVGGFQIMPLKHALTSTEMISSWSMTQWLIISPLPNYPDLEGHEPLYKNSFLPGTQLNDKLPDVFSQYGRRPLVICRRNGGNWEKLPEVSGKSDDALKDVTHLRLYFPFWNL